MHVATPDFDALEVARVKSTITKELERVRYLYV